jgi:DNA-binding transcriptional MerR regulator
MPERVFSKYEIDRLFPDVASRTLASWIERGLVQAVSERKDRRGTVRLFARESVYQFGILRQLTQLSVPMPEIAHVMKLYFSVEQISENMEKLLGIGMNPPDGKHGLLREFELQDWDHADIMLADLLDAHFMKTGAIEVIPFDMVLVLNLPGIRSKLDAKIEGRIGA